MNSISYIYWNIDPEIFRLGGFGLRYYSICFLLAFASSYYILLSIFNKEGVSETLLSKLTIYIFVGTLAGARLGHCLFYEWNYYSHHIVEIFLPFAIKNGHFEITGFQGLASHGGAIGILTAVLLFCRKYKLNVWWLTDRLVIVVALAAFFVRLGNLFNSEIIGKTADLPWAFVFQRVDGLPRHPAQLYEATCYLIIFFILRRIFHKYGPGLKPGFLFGIFLVLLFTVRFIVEFIKEDQEAFENGMLINMGQILSIPFILSGLVLMSTHFLRNKKVL